MPKRLQIVVRDEEYREIKRAAQSRGIAVSAWVREALGQACRRSATDSIDRKKKAIEAAARYQFPAGDVETMLAEIEQGYLPPSRRG